MSGGLRLLGKNLGFGWAKTHPGPSLDTKESPKPETVPNNYTNLLQSFRAHKAELAKKQEPLAKKEWEALPAFPIRCAESLCCPICGPGVEIKRLYGSVFLWTLIPDEKYHQLIKEMWRSTFYSGSIADSLSLCLSDHPTMSCTCSCGHSWKMKVLGDKATVYTSKSFCPFCGCNYDRKKNESCPGCGARDSE